MTENLRNTDSALMDSADHELFEGWSNAERLAKQCESESAPFVEQIRLLQAQYGERVRMGFQEYLARYRDIFSETGPMAVRVLNGPNRHAGIFVDLVEGTAFRLARNQRGVRERRVPISDVEWFQYSTDIWRDLQGPLKDFFEPLLRERRRQMLLEENQRHGGWRYPPSGGWGPGMMSGL